ncbi:transposase domain-containing protein, partial [Mesorhizobium sp.]|uniref:transposase domain-containing protein n=1 Tax=Mesorhizobium sp. TaxID=1871066 RepID=UPI0025F5F5FF
RESSMFIGLLQGALVQRLPCKVNGISPEASLADLIGRVRDHPANRIDELLLWDWRARSGTRLAA